MRYASETGVRRLHKRMLVLTTASALVLSGCISPAFRESVGQFGAATKAAMTGEAERLGRVRESEVNRQRDEVARSGANLEVERTPDCTALRQGQGTGECRLVRGDGVALRRIVQSANTIALGNALANYSDSLVALAADSTADQAAFTNSVTAVGTSLSNLNNAIRAATGAPEEDLSAPVGAIARLVAELGNLYFQHRRNVVLRRVITEGAPAVSRAIGLMRRAATAAAGYERALLNARLLAAEAHDDDVMGRPADLEARREAQRGLFESVNALNRYDTRLRLFHTLSEAHDKLVAAARSGASSAEILAALQAAIQLATTVRATVAALN